MKKRVWAILLIAFILPTLYITVFAETENLPGGFVPMEKIFKIEDGDGTQPYDYEKVDGLYLQLDYVKTRVKSYDAYYGIADPRDDGSGGYTISQSLSDKPYVTVMREKTADGFSVTGTHNFEYVYAEDDGSLHAGDKVYRYSDMSVSITNFTFEEYNVYADLSGTVTTKWGSNGSSNSQTETPSGTHTRALHKLEDGKIYLVFTVDHLTYRFRIAGVLPQGVKSDGVVQNASQNAGEDEGVTVPAAIAVGVAASLAAVAGAAVGSSSGSGNSGDPENKTYKMYVQKDFGDAIRRGADPVKVRARMAEVDENGAEHDRNDLTARINTRGDGLEMRGSGMSGRYFEADVYAPEDNKNSQASVIFIYEGPDGAFTNQVIFRLIDGPSLEFAEEEPEGSGNLKFYTCNYGIDAIPGDGFTYSALFMIVDAPKAPALSDINSQIVEGYDVTFEETKWQYVYKANVKNNTPEEKTDDVFAKVKDNQIEISVAVEGEKDPVRGWLTMHMYPEGLTVQSKDEGKKNGVKYVRIQSYEKENAGDLDKKWQVSEMKFTLAVKDENKALIDPEGMEFSFDKIKGAGGKGTGADKEQAIADKYDYKETYGMRDDKYSYVFEPNVFLWEPDNGTFFVLALPVCCTYDGETYKIDVPLRMRGKDPDPMEEWNKEYAKARERIEKYSLPSQKAHNLEQLEKIAAVEPHISTWELRLMCKDVVRSYMKYWTEQHEKDEWTVSVLDWTVWGLEWVKWIGDCAFSYVVAAYAGPMEALISPAKEVLVSALGEVGVNIVWGTKFNVENLEVVAQLKNAGDNFVSGWASDGVSNLLKTNPANYKAAIAIMGAYFAYACLNNYLEHMAKTGESDFYGAIMGAFKDLSLTAIKAAASFLFGKWLESENFKNKIGPKISEFMSKHFGENCRINLSDQAFSQRVETKVGSTKYWLDIDAEITKSGIVEKYFTDLCGEGVAFIHDNIEKVSKNLFWISPAGDIMFSYTINLLAGNVDNNDVLHLCDLNLSSALKNTSSGLFNWLYNLFFSGVPVADTVMEMPKDPPLPPAKN